MINFFFSIHFLFHIHSRIFKKNKTLETTVKEGKITNLHYILKILNAQTKLFKIQILIQYHFLLRSQTATVPQARA